MRYPGGKGKCYQRLINLMPSHDTYIESHLGGGAVLRHKRPARVNIGVDADLRVIRRWSVAYPDLCTLVHADAATFLEEYSFEGGELIYADPPYVAATRRRSRVYRHDYAESDHERLLSVLEALPCMVMISGYDSPMYRDRLRDWRVVTFRVKTHVHVVQEWVWLNFDQLNALHDGSYLGDSFRDRQTIKRRHSRLLDRIGRMDPAERNHVLRLLNERFDQGPGTQ